MLQFPTVPAPRTRTPPGGRRAAIAACFRIDPSTGAAMLLFIRRAINPRDPWSGNVAFPGGKQEPDDGDDDEGTAMRETTEEVGLDLHSWRRLGRLTEDRTIRPRGKKTMVISLFGFILENGEDPPLRPEAGEVADAWWVPVNVLGPEMVEWRSMPIQQLWPALRQRPALLRLCRACGSSRVRYASIPLPPPPTPEASSAVTAPEGGEGDYPLEDRYLLWGLTLGFLSDTRRRSALATPLIGDGAAGGFDQPFRSGAGGPLVDGAMRMLLFPKKRRSRSQSQPPQIDWWRVLSLWPIQVAIAVVVVGLVKARLAHLREEAGITRGEFDFHPLFRDEL
jgi:8-oxo-dGTP pyrophosphatase MutT (NUDIX family)